MALASNDLFGIPVPRRTRVSDSVIATEDRSGGARSSCQHVIRDKSTVTDRTKPEFRERPIHSTRSQDSGHPPTSVDRRRAVIRISSLVRPNVEPWRNHICSVSLGVA